MGVVDTTKCEFSDMEIYPGHGLICVRKMGTKVTYISSKCKRLHGQGKKAAKITWTRTWRIKNKKALVERSTKKIKKKGRKVQRAIVGLNLDELASRRSDTFRNEQQAKRRKALAAKKKAKKSTKAVKGKGKKGKK